MANSAVSLFLYADFCLAIGFYMYLRRNKERIGFQLGMNSSIAMGGIIGLLVGILLILQFPFHFTLITIISTVVGGITGAFFGQLVDYQTLVMGLTNGIFIGLMSPMIGTVIEMQVIFVWFLHIVFAGSLLTIFISIKRV